jgi:hypothetical protein
MSCHLTDLCLVIIIRRVRVEYPEHIGNAARSESPDLTATMMVEEWLHQVLSRLVKHRAVVIIQTLTLTQILIASLDTNYNPHNIIFLYW